MATISKSQYPSRISDMQRYGFIDDYRGLAIISMILVNYVAFYPSVPQWLKHAEGNGFNFADLVAPMFLFVLGIMFRPSLLSRIQKLGSTKAYLSMLRRFLIIMTIGFIGGTVAKSRFGFDWGVLQAIGFAGIIALPFVYLKWCWRALVVGILLLSYQFLILPTYVNIISTVDHGGPIACISWATIILSATIASDFFHGKTSSKRFLALFLISFAASFLVINYFIDLPIMKLSVNIPYILISITISSAIFIGFMLLEEMAKIRVPTLEVLGKNALFIFVAHYIIVRVAYKVTGQSASLVIIIVAVFLIYILCYTLAWILDKKKWYLRI